MGQGLPAATSAAQAGRRGEEPQAAQVLQGQAPGGRKPEEQGNDGAEEGGLKSSERTSGHLAAKGVVQTSGENDQGRGAFGGVGSTGADTHSAGGAAASSSPLGSGVAAADAAIAAGVPGQNPAVQTPDPTPSASPEQPRQVNPPPPLGLSGVSVRIERPHTGTTSQAIQPLAGRVSGGAVKGIVVDLNGRQQLLDAWGNAFEGEVILRRGNNQIRIVAMGARGPLAEKSVEVQYVPPPPSSAIKITRPADGAVLSAANQELIEVEGEVFDAGIRQAQVIFNEFAIPVTVKDGRFSAFIPAIAPEMTIWADARGDHGSHSSDPVTVRREPYKAVKAYVLLHLPTASRKIDARLWLSHRAAAADRDSPRKITSHFPSGAPASEQTSTLFALPAMQDGAYTLALDYRIPSGESVDKGWCSVIVPGTNGYRNLRLGPFRLTGKGRVVLAKFLRPYGIFWDEDYWFTASAEGSDSFTKFRHTESVSWRERKGEPEFPTSR